MAAEDRPTRAVLTGPVEHWCQYPGCKKWGGWGNERGTGETDWFCYEHRPVQREHAAHIGPYIRLDQSGHR
jgi:hypothetical protein